MKRDMGSWKSRLEKVFRKLRMASICDSVSVANENTAASHLGLLTGPLLRGPANFYFVIIGQEGTTYESTRLLSISLRAVQPRWVAARDPYKFLSPKKIVLLPHWIRCSLCGFTARKATGSGNSCASYHNMHALLTSRMTLQGP